MTLKVEILFGLRIKFLFRIILLSFWDHFDIVLRSCWDDFQIILGSFCDHVGISFGSSSDNVGGVLGSCWDYLFDNFGIILGTFSPSSTELAAFMFSQPHVSTVIVVI